MSTSPSFTVKVSGGADRDVQSFYSTAYSTSVGAREPVTQPPQGIVPQIKPTGVSLNARTSVTIGNPEEIPREWTSEYVSSSSPMNSQNRPATTSQTQFSAYVASGAVSTAMGQTVTMPTTSFQTTLIPTEYQKGKRRDPIAFENEGRGPQTWSTSYSSAYDSKIPTIPSTSPSLGKQTAEAVMKNKQMDVQQGSGYHIVNNPTNIVSESIRDDDPALRQRALEFSTPPNNSSSTTNVPNTMTTAYTGANQTAAVRQPYKTDDPELELKNTGQLSAATMDKMKRRDPALYDSLVNPSQYCTTAQTVGRNLETRESPSIPTTAAGSKRPTPPGSKRTSGSWGFSDTTCFTIGNPETYDSADTFTTTQEQEHTLPVPQVNQTSVATRSSTAFAKTSTTTVGPPNPTLQLTDQEELAQMHPKIAAMQATRDPVRYGLDPAVNRTHDHKKH